MYTSESLSSTLPIAVDGTLPAYLALRSQVHSQEGRHFQSHLTIAPMYAPACSFQRLAELQAPGGVRLVVYGGRRAACGMWRVACGRQRMLAEIMTSVDMVV
jgi:hypothetical protein